MIFVRAVMKRLGVNKTVVVINHFRGGMERAVISMGVLLISAALITGCSSQGKNVSPMRSISDEARASLASPVRCRTARSDIAALEAERASIGQRVIAGARAVFPISAVAGILSGDYNDRTAVATGKYNDDISAKIDQIRATCGIEG